MTLVKIEVNLIDLFKKGYDYLKGILKKEQIYFKEKIEISYNDLERIHTDYMNNLTELSKKKIDEQARYNKNYYLVE